MTKNILLTETQKMEEMDCSAARYKLEEAKYFHSKLLENYSDDRLLNFYFNALFYSSRSVLDYIWSNFLLSKIKPGVSSQKWFYDPEYKKETRKEHPERELIQRFETLHSKKVAELKDDPMMYHLLKKRDVITHHSYAGTMGGLYTGKPGEEGYRHRYLETMWTETYLEKRPELRIDFGKEISDEQRKELEDKLRRKDMRPILDYYLEKLGVFIKEFEELDLEKMR